MKGYISTNHQKLSTRSRWQGGMFFKKIFYMGLLVGLLFGLSGCAVLEMLNPQVAIDFVSNPGTYVDHIAKLPGANITEPTPPTRENYDFGGWYEDRELTIPYVFDKMPFKNLTLFAKWNGDTLTTLDGLHLLLKWDDTYGVLGYDGPLIELEIPSSYMGKDITSIEIFAFQQNTTLTNIVLPNTITKIDIGAFNNMLELQSMIIPKSVKSIGDAAFADNYQLRTIFFEENSELETIGDAAFFNTTALQGIVFPSSLKHIGEAAFESSRVSAILFEPNSQLETIGGGAFYTSSLRYVQIPIGVTSIQTSLFFPYYWMSQYGYNKILIFVEAASKPTNWVDEWCDEHQVIWNHLNVTTTITFDTQGGSSLVSLSQASGTLMDEPTLPTKNDFFFAGWYRDVEYRKPFYFFIMPEESITLYAAWSKFHMVYLKIGYQMVDYIGTNTYVVVPDTHYNRNVTSIGSTAFANAQHVEVVRLYNYLRRIESGAFANLPNLQTVYIPSTVEYVGSNAFLNSPNVTIYIDLPSAPLEWSDTWNPDNLPVVWNSQP